MKIINLDFEEFFKKLFRFSTEGRGRRSFNEDEMVAFRRRGRNDNRGSLDEAEAGLMEKAF